MTERQWQGIFNPRLSSVANRFNDQKAVDIPAAMDLYAPIERRLDVAMFRSFFASSPKQAREFVARGHVKVNGQRVSTDCHFFAPCKILIESTDET